MNPTLSLNETNFDRAVQQADHPVLVDFWADWCGPCKMLAPVLNEVAQENQGRVTVAKVNVDENPALAERFNIRSIPTLLYFSGGELRDQTIGLVGKKAIVTKISALQAESVATWPA